MPESNFDERKSFSSYLLPASIVIAAVLIAAAVFLSPGGNPTPAPTTGNPSGQPALVNPIPKKMTGAPPLTGEDVILGDPKAPVTFIEYADYQCPFCEKFHSDTGVKVRDQYIRMGKVRMVFRNFPFLDQAPGGQNESHLAAEAAECAKDQGKFWAFHDALFDFKAKDTDENSGNLNRDLFQKIARDLGLNTVDFLNCFDAHKYAGKIEADIASGQAYGVESTPTVFIDDIKIDGAMPFEAFGNTDSQVTPYKPIIDSELKKVSP